MNFTGERWIPGQVDRRIEDDHSQRYQFALRYSPGRRVLDIACGVGAGTHLLATRGGAAATAGVDISPDAIAHARQHYTAPGLRYEVGDIEKYTPAEAFDLITCFETIEHVPDDRLTLRNLWSWLKPGGVLLISSPNRPITSPSIDTIDGPPTNSFHVREFTPAELRERMATAGFSGFRTFGQRLRWHVGSGRVVKLLNMMRRASGSNPDHDGSPAVRRFWLRTPRYFVIEARR